MATTTQPSVGAGAPIKSPGWFIDPLDARKMRYWDGHRWTDQVNHRELAPPVGEPFAVAPPATHTPGPGLSPAASHSVTPTQTVTAPIQTTNVDHINHRTTGRRMPANVLSALAVIGGLLALILLPLYTGLIAIALAIGAIARGERFARLGLKVAVVGFIVGMIWAYVSAKFGLGL